MSTLSQTAPYKPKPQTGSLVSISPFESKFVASRQIDIWLPKGYQLDDSKSYAVIYMHDGQNLFDKRFGFNGQTWAADVAMQKLIDTSEVRPAIIVGIWNTAKRFEEYFPAPAYEGLTAYQQYIIRGERSGVSQSDHYLRFITEELKPFIDHNFKTDPGIESTFIGGSSMGGLISAYAMATYPHIFGGAACISTHWPLSIESNDTAFSRPFMMYLAKRFPQPGLHRFYFDHGTETMDARYELHQKVMDGVMLSLGYTHGSNWLTCKYEGHAHNEAAWRKRLHIPFRFLLA